MEPGLSSCAVLSYYGARDRLGADIIIHHVGIYYKYNPFPVLRTSHGPKFSTMTVGLKVAF